MKFTPAELYRLAIRHIDTHCRQQYRAAFADLGAQDQDALLGELEKDAIDLPDVPAKTFFVMLLELMSYVRQAWGNGRTMRRRMFPAETSPQCAHRCVNKRHRHRATDTS